MILNRTPRVRRPAKVAIFTLKENYSLSSSKHRMNPETVSPLHGYLLSAFRPEQVQFIHIDSNYNNPEGYFGEQFDIVGINAHWKGIKPVKDAISTWPLKKMSKHVFIEGSFLNALKDGREYLSKFLRESACDASLIYGEPEPAVAGLIESFLSGRDIRNVPNLLLPRNNWQTAIPRQRTDLSMIAVQPYQYLDSMMGFPLHTFHVETSRGCYFGGCTFCTDAKIWGSGWRGYPVENVVSLFMDMRSKGVDYGFIFDKDFWGNDLERAQVLASALIKYGNSIPYLVALRADEIINGEHLLQSFKKSGMAFVFIGAETFSNEIAERYNKGVSVEDTLRAIQILRKEDIDFGLGYIIDPLGSFEELRESMEVIRSNRLWGHISSIFNVMDIRSGTAYESMASKAGILGERMDEALNFQYDFLDPKVGCAVEIAKKWLRDVNHVNVFFLIAKRMTHGIVGRSQAEYAKYYRYLHLLQKIDFDFFYSLLELIQQKRESEIQALKADAAQRYKEAVSEILSDLDPSDPVSGFLLKIIKDNICIC